MLDYHSGNSEVMGRFSGSTTRACILILNCVASFETNHNRRTKPIHHHHGDQQNVIDMDKYRLL